MTSQPETSPHAQSVPGLLRELSQETTTLLRQEVDLAKAEMRENISRVGSHTAQIAVGGFVAYSGIIVLLIGLGHLLGAILVRAGLDAGVAEWLAPTGLGLVVALVGWGMLARAKHALAQDDLAPRQTAETIRENKEWAQRKLHSS